MKTINETFTDEEHNLLKKLKGNISWHDFIMLMAVHCKEAEKRGDFEVFRK
jgi:predicted CopG family antitoxin